MRKLGIILIGLIVSLTSVVVAQPEGDFGKGRPERGRMHRADGERSGGMFCGFYEAVGATEEQKEKLKTIFKAQFKKIRQLEKANREKYRDAMKAMREATTKEEFQAANKNLRQLFMQRIKLHQEFEGELGKVLDESQLEKAKAYFKEHAPKQRRGGRGKERGKNGNGHGNMLFRGLKLSDEQKEKIRDIMTDARKQCKNAEGPERGEIMKGAMDKVMNDVLTEDQAAQMKKRVEKFGKGRRGGKGQHPLDGIVTDEQMKKIDAIMSDARKEAKNAEPEKRREIMQAAREKVANEILSEEQREKLREKFEKMKNRRGDRRGRRGRGDHRGPGRDRKGPECDEKCGPEGGRKGPECDDKCGPEGGRKGAKFGRRGPRGDRRGSRRGGMMKDFTEDQKAAAKKIMEEARAKAKDAGPEERREIMKAAFEKINKEVLTDEQREKMKKMRRRERSDDRRRGYDGERGKGPRAGRIRPGRGGMMKDLNEDQKAAAKKIMEEARAKAKDAGPEERREIMKAAFEKINKEVMTDEQREKMKKMRHRRRPGHGERCPEGSKEIGPEDEPQSKPADLPEPPVDDED